MATIDDGRAQLFAGQAQQLKEDTRRAGEALRCGRLEEAAQLVANIFLYSCAVACELDYLTKPAPEPRVRGKSRAR